MPELLAADGEVISTAPTFDKAAADAQFTQAMVSEPSGDLPLREVQADGQEPPKRRGRRPKAEQPRVTSAPTRAAGPALTGDQRRDGVRSIAQVIAMFPLLAAKATGNPAFAADAITITDAGDDAADACAKLAEHDPRFAAALDRVCAAGPYGALVGVGVSVTMQLMRNHKPDAKLPGTVHPNELLANSVAAQQAAA